MPWLVLALTVLAGAGAAFAADDEADSRLRYAREALLAQARAAVGGEATDPNLEPLRDALGREEEALRTWKAKGAALPPDERAAWTELETLVPRQRLILGVEAAPAETRVTSTSGALAQARWLHRWLRGLEPCEIVVRARPTDAPASYRYVPGSPPPPPSPTPAAPADAAAKPPEAPPPDPAEPWAAFVRSVLEQQKSLVGKTLSTAPKSDLSALFQAARGEASPGGGAVAQADESPSAERPAAPPLAAQSKERYETYCRAPTASVDESTVREDPPCRGAIRHDAYERRRVRRSPARRCVRVPEASRASDLAGAIDEGGRRCRRCPPWGTGPRPRPSLPTAAPCACCLSLRLCSRGPRGARISDAPLRRAALGDPRPLPRGREAAHGTCR
jgi:hypothetical protein